MSRPFELPSDDRFLFPDVNRYKPTAYPPNLADRSDKSETLLVGPRGEPLLLRVPRRLGFRPEDAA